MERAEELYRRIEKLGEKAIDEFILDRQSEELFLDFKRSSDNGAGRRLSQNDRDNLAKAISGFGNSEGGVIVWGIDCSADKHGADLAKMKIPLADAKRFQSWLEGAVSGCTIPPHSGVRNVAIPVTGSANGYVATYVPKSNAAPHQVVGKLQYFMRAGSAFVPVPHGVLAGMFGRRPQSQIGILFLTSPCQLAGNTIVCSVGCAIRNWGQGIGRDLFINASIINSPSGTSEIGLEVQQETKFTGAFSLGFQLNLISEPTFRLPPEAAVQPVIIRMRLCPPFNKAIHLEIATGAAESPPWKGAMICDEQRMLAVHTEYTRKIREGLDSKGFCNALFRIPAEHGAST